MNYVYSVVFEYIFPDIDNDTVFVTLDKDEAIEKARTLFAENVSVNPNERPILSQFKNVEFKDNFLNRIAVEETPLGVDILKHTFNLPKDTPRTKVIFTAKPEISEKEQFSNALIELFNQDLQMTPSTSEIDEIWDLFKKDKSVFETKKSLFPEQIHSADILKILKKEKEYSAMMDIENKLR